MSEWTYVHLGQSVLANQFVTGLGSELKAEVMSSEDNMEQLLVKTGFKETKQRKLAIVIQTW